VAARCVRRGRSGAPQRTFPALVSGVPKARLAGDGAAASPPKSFAATGVARSAAATSAARGSASLAAVPRAPRRVVAGVADTAAGVAATSIPSARA
jgi:hypothetical protein